MKTKLSICLLLLAYSYSYGQIKNYDYQRDIKNVSEQWHKLILPNDIFGKIQYNMSDVRIFGINTNNDTIETPYILRVYEEKTSKKEVEFKTINASFNSKGFYYTLTIPSEETINQIELQFTQQNFDWQVTLEGSQNQKEWFTIVEDYRVLSIKNELTDFKFTKIIFPNSNYQFFRISINSKEKPELMSAKLYIQETTAGVFNSYTSLQTQPIENKEKKLTEFDLNLDVPLPISHIKINVTDSIDYYRYFTIKYLVDSIKTEQGWKYNYNTLTSGTLNSLENNEFKVNSTPVKKLKFIIHNQDNRPLTISSIEIKGYVYELIARFTEQANYFLVYGNQKNNKPNYDISQFIEKIPESLSPLELGNEQTIQKTTASKSKALFENSFWLWLIISITIIMLGGFTLKMVRKS